jgi:iron-sulfur cluster assembly accessory protein|tara:strand:- start:157 stop:462 length:306 start_codon:yes stop_codon:yes gene_type:complete
MNITPSAEKKIEQTLNDSEYLRVEVNGGGCSGFTVGLSKTDGANESDIWLNGNLVIDSISAEYLSKATLDWIDDAFSPTFKFDIPNTKSCGCGNSFTLEET